MQIASRELLWNSGGRGTVVEVEMTPATGRRIRLLATCRENEPYSVDWGDGASQDFPYKDGFNYEEHTYASYGRYRIRYENASGVGLRHLDGMAQYSYDAAPVSLVDYSGKMVGTPSGSFKKAVNLVHFEAPAITGIGQRTLGYCTSLRKVVLPICSFFYDGTFQGCTSLETLDLGGGIMWSYVFKGCTKLREIRFKGVDQISTQCFSDCPALADIWIPDRTIAQTRQVASSGNIVGGYGAKFPWGANAYTRFHCLDGVVLGSGTVVN